MLPSAKPSLTHCTLPARFVISHFSSASVPSSTWTFVGCVRKYCLLAVTDDATKKGERVKNVKFKLESIKTITAKWRWSFIVSHSLLSTSQLREWNCQGEGESEAVKQSALTCGRKMMNRFSPRQIVMETNEWKEFRIIILNYQTSTETEEEKKEQRKGKT